MRVPKYSHFVRSTNLLDIVTRTRSALIYYYTLPHLPKSIDLRDYGVSLWSHKLLLFDSVAQEHLVPSTLGDPRPECLTRLPFSIAASYVSIVKFSTPFFHEFTLTLSH